MIQWRPIRPATAATVPSPPNHWRAASRERTTSQAKAAKNTSAVIAW